MKTAEELIALKEEVETLSKKLAELTEEELAQVSGGMHVLTTIREKEILAATGTITSSDRVTLQKEIDSLIDQIDEDAL